MKLFTKIRTTYIALSTALFLAVPGMLAASDVDVLNQTLKESAGSAGLDTKTDLATAIGRPIGYIFGLIGVIFLIMTVLGGFLWMIAGGNEEKVHRAKSIIGNGVNGLIVMFFAYALVYVVLAALGYSASR